MCIYLVFAVLRSIWIQVSCRFLHVQIGINLNFILFHFDALDNVWFRCRCTSTRFSEPKTVHSSISCSALFPTTSAWLLADILWSYQYVSESRDCLHLLPAVCRKWEAFNYILILLYSGAHKKGSLTSNYYHKIRDLVNLLDSFSLLLALLNPFWLSHISLATSNNFW